MKLIDVDALIERLKPYAHRYDDDDELPYSYIYNSFIYEIEQEPTADAVPIRQLLNDAEIHLSPGTVWSADEKQIEKMVIAELSEMIGRKLTKGRSIEKRLDPVSGMYVYKFGKEEKNDEITKL